jgi:hypothetical protein
MGPPLALLAPGWDDARNWKWSTTTYLRRWSWIAPAVSFRSRARLSRLINDYLRRSKLPLLPSMAVARRVAGCTAKECGVVGKRLGSHARAAEGGRAVRSARAQQIMWQRSQAEEAPTARSPQKPGRRTEKPAFPLACRCARCAPIGGGMPARPPMLRAHWPDHARAAATARPAARGARRMAWPWPGACQCMTMRALFLVSHCDQRERRRETKNLQLAANGSFFSSPS